MNNAGVYGPKGAIEEIDWEQWVKAIEINLLGTVYMCRLAAPIFKARVREDHQPLGRRGDQPAAADQPYAASKAAVVRMTDTLAEELKDWKIDVNAIAPAALNTRLLDEVLEAGPGKIGHAFYERSLKQRQQGGAPLEKGAELAVFLASGASDGITGRLIGAVWDGWKDFPRRREQIAGSDVFTLRRIVPKDRGMEWE